MILNYEGKFRPENKEDFFSFTMKAVKHWQKLLRE